ncbi:MAG: hypothetical protein IJ617_02660, partial [Oscillospiraceae bacterium]|nr:hypothetical protein [Oscillospiraceae bacterium]
FPGSSAPTPALNLKSGSTYHFEFDRIEDTAAQGNIMRGTPFRLPDFTVVAAKINLSKAEDEYRINQTQKISRDDSGAPIRDVTGEPRYVAAEEADVRVDSAFFLYPSSLKVDNSVIWDMIIWADRTCEIQLYRLDDTGWTLLNDTPQPISVPTTTAYNGLSLRRDFIGIEDSFARLAELEEGRNYEYAIHLTRLGQDGEGSSRSTDPEGWRGEIHFGVSVISGTTTNLNNFYSSNLMQRYSTFTTQVGDGRLLDIGTPHPFTDSRILMTKSFADKSIPSFQAGFPSLVDLADRSARISLRTDASARLFYVIMPGMNSSVVNRTHSTVATYPDPLADGVDTETVIVDDASRDVFIDEVRDAAAANATWYIGSTTNRPGKSWVTDASPSTIPTNGAKMGYLDLVPGITDYLSVSGLNANSRYFVYFVLQGDGEASDPYVYTFRTPSASAPILRADGFDTTATVQLYYPETRTTVKWVLVNSNLLDQLGTRFFGSDGFNTLFSGEEIVDEQAKASGRYGSFWRSQYESYTITEAITEPVLDGNRVLGSVFDLFATEAAKSEVSRNLDSAPYGNVIVEVGSFELTNATATSPATRTINLNEKNLIKGTQYTLLARATASNSEDSSGQGFAGCAPMQIPEKQTPQLDPGQELTVTLTTDTYSNDDGTISGSITLMFDQALYVMTGGKLIPIDRAAPDAADTDRISIADTRLSENLDPDTIKVRTNGEAGTAVSTIVLDLDHTRGGTFRFGGQDYQISSVDRYTTNIPVSLILNYSGELFTVQVTDWNHSDERRASRDPEERADYGTVKYEKTIQLRTSTIDVESVSIYNSKTNSTASTITISQNETIQLTALYQPPNATNATVRWINSDTAEDYISLGSTAGETIELTGKAATRRGVTVTAYCGGKQATITVNVNAVILPSTIRFQDSSTLNLVQGGDAEIVSYYLEPSNATDRDIEYWWYRQSGSNQIDEDRFPPTVRVLSDGSLEIRATAQVSGGLYNLKLMSKADNEVYALKTVKVIEATQENP